MSASGPPIAWHALEPSACLDQLSAAPDGLTSVGAAQRLVDFGPNRLEISGGRSSLRILWDQFSNVMLIMLLAVAVGSGAVAIHQSRFPKDALAILLIVGLKIGRAHV